MNTRKPPALATWLLNRLAPGEKRESLIGDLIEQHQHGRSSAWYWRQAVSVIGAHLAATLWTYQWLAVSVIALNGLLPYLYRSFISHWIAVVDKAWYSPLMNWLVEREGNTVRHAVYGLTTGLTGQLAWCVLIASVTWIVVRMRPDARRMVVTLLVLSEIGQCIPGLQHALSSWLHHPESLIGILMAFRFAVFTFVAIPLTILWAGRAASRHWGSEAAA